MEELNIEQKAKRYDEILARAKDTNMPHDMKEFVDYLIPELKEGEDERIRKKLISYFSNVKGFSSLEYNYGITQEEAVAWLEKQGEQQPAEDNCKISDCVEKVDMTEYNNGYGCGKQRVLKYPEDYGLYKKPDWSEEDENLLKLSLENLTELKDRFGEKYGKVSDCIHWLNSLMQRMKGE